MLRLGSFKVEQNKKIRCQMSAKNGITRMSTRRCQTTKTEKHYKCYATNGSFEKLVSNYSKQFWSVFSFELIAQVDVD